MWVVFGITEPNAGSDVMAMKSTAQDKGDHWLLNGSKTWISNASAADALVFYAYTDREARGERAVRLCGGDKEFQWHYNH